MLADEQILGVNLGELIHVNAADHVEERLAERKHRQLDKVELRADQRR